MAFNERSRDGAKFNEKVKLLWIGMGTLEHNPFPGAIGAFSAMLNKARIDYFYFSSPDTAHEWLTWRDLSEIAPRLFKYQCASSDAEGMKCVESSPPR
jgi:enterochelin esterase family protein